MLHLLMLCMRGRQRRWGHRAAPLNRQRYPMLLHVRRAPLVCGQACVAGKAPWRTLS